MKNFPLVYRYGKQLNWDFSAAHSSNDFGVNLICFNSFLKTHQTHFRSDQISSLAKWPANFHPIEFFLCSECFFLLVSSLQTYGSLPMKLKRFAYIYAFDVVFSHSLAECMKTRWKPWRFGAWFNFILSINLIKFFSVCCSAGRVRKNPTIQQMLSHKLFIFLFYFNQLSNCSAIFSLNIEAATFSKSASQSNWIPQPIMCQNRDSSPFWSFDSSAEHSRRLNNLWSLTMNWFWLPH